jgi:hypothetical protein
MSGHEPDGATWNAAAVALTYPSFFGPDNIPPLAAFARLPSGRWPASLVPKSGLKMQLCCSIPPILPILRGQLRTCTLAC